MNCQILLLRWKINRLQTRRAYSYNEALIADKQLMIPARQFTCAMMALKLCPVKWLSLGVR